jgi:putative acetyltransferase
MIIYREFEMKDYEAVLDLWRSTPGIALSGADERDAIERFARRNPGLCWLAEKDGRIVGTTFCGQDGRRGYIHHTAVAVAFQRKGIAQALLERCFAALAEQGIQKCHLFVVKENESGVAFWRKRDWQERTDIVMFSKTVK